MSCQYKSLSFFDVFVHFWSEATMADNKRKALLSGNDFQRFLISSQSHWDKATIFQLFWQRECCVKFPFFMCKMWFSDWNLHFLELEYKGHMLLFVPREMAEEMLRFKALPNLIWSKNIYFWSCTVITAQSLIQGLGVPSGTDCSCFLPPPSKKCMCTGEEQLCCIRPRVCGAQQPISNYGW